MATESELVGIRGTNTYLERMRFWAAQRDPASFNTWQEAMSQIRKIFSQDPDLPSAGPGYT